MTDRKKMDETSDVEMDENDIIYNNEYENDSDEEDMDDDMFTMESRDLMSEQRSSSTGTRRQTPALSYNIQQSLRSNEFVGSYDERKMKEERELARAMRESQIAFEKEKQRRLMNDYEQWCHILPMSCLPNEELLEKYKTHIYESDAILLPNAMRKNFLSFHASIQDYIDKNNEGMPTIFKIINYSHNVDVQCCLLDFIDEEQDIVYISNWMYYILTHKEQTFHQSFESSEDRLTKKPMRKDYVSPNLVKHINPITDNKNNYREPTIVNFDKKYCLKYIFRNLTQGRKILVQPLQKKFLTVKNQLELFEHLIGKQFRFITEGIVIPSNDPALQFFVKDVLPKNENHGIVSTETQLIVDFYIPKEVNDTWIQQIDKEKKAREKRKKEIEHLKKLAMEEEDKRLYHLSRDKLQAQRLNFLNKSSTVQREDPTVRREDPTVRRDVQTVRPKVETKVEAKEDQNVEEGHMLQSLEIEDDKPKTREELRMKRLQMLNQRFK